MAALNLAKRLSFMITLLKILLLSISGGSSLSLNSMTLDILYIMPSDIKGIKTINDKPVFSSVHSQGWLMPSNEPFELDFYLHYNGFEKSRLDSYFETKNDLLINNEESNKTTSVLDKYDKDEIQPYVSVTTFYIFFTTKKTCEDQTLEPNRPLVIDSKMSSNVYRARVSNVILQYSGKMIEKNFSILKLF
jgi:hypothetical protein